ncbi:MAG: MOSC domain-containing protein [Phototrophicaceae bacterium]|jgi:MOSC domain-containing protein YiiM
MTDAPQTQTDYIEQLTARGQSPADDGTLEMIVRRPSKGERETLDRAELTPASGLVGDSWHLRKSEPDPKTQLTLMNSRVVDVIAGGERARWPLAGDQLYVDLDLSAENLPPGQQIQIGTAIVEVSEVPHNGCGNFTERYGSDATKLVNSPEGRAARRRGINARVVQAGVVHVGDAVRKVR